MKSFAIILTAFASIAAARTTPAPGDPAGNPIAHPGLDEQVVAGKTFDITWQPTVGKDSTVSIILLRGPSNNVKPIQTIVEGVPNNGKYTWNVPSTLENDKTHYGIQLIVDTSGAYQYSTQFGVDNKNGPAPPVPVPSGGGSSAPPAPVSPYPTATGGGYPTETAPLITGTGGTYADISTLLPCPTDTEEPTPCPTTVETSAVPAPPASTYAPPPAGNASTPTQGTQPIATGAASSVKVGLGMLVGAMALVAAI